MNSRKTFTTFFLLILTLSFTNAYAWGPAGHRIVAEVAQNNLSTEAKNMILEIQAELNLAKIATYPDDMKSAPDKKTFIWAKCKNNKCIDYQQLWKDTYNWHFVSVKDDFKSFDNLNAKIRIQEAIDILKYSDNNLTKRGALSWLVHLVGDIHQPLHDGRSSDMGGNTIWVKFFNKPYNLHQIWDSKMIDYFALSYTEYSNFLSTSTDYITSIDGYFSNKNYKIFATDNLDEMLQNSLKEVQNIYSGLPKDRNLGFDYIYQNSTILNKQLLTAGISLAMILNNIAKNK